MSKGNANISMFVNDNNNNKDEDEEELEYRDGYGYGYGYDNLINREFYCDLKLVPFVTQLFEILEMETGFPLDASQKVECLLKKHPNVAGIYSNLHGDMHYTGPVGNKHLWRLLLH